MPAFTVAHLQSTLRAKILQSFPLILQIKQTSCRAVGFIPCQPMSCSRASALVTLRLCKKYELLFLSSVIHIRKNISFLNDQVISFTVSSSVPLRKPEQSEFCLRNPLQLQRSIYLCEYQNKVNLLPPNPWPKDQVVGIVFAFFLHCIPKTLPQWSHTMHSKYLLCQRMQMYYI